jgi:hypothetical protein
MSLFPFGGIIRAIFLNLIFFLCFKWMKYMLKYMLVRRMKRRKNIQCGKKVDRRSIVMRNNDIARSRFSFSSFFKLRCMKSITSPGFLPSPFNSVRSPWSWAAEVCKICKSRYLACAYLKRNPLHKSGRESRYVDFKGRLMFKHGSVRYFETCCTISII